MQRYTIAICENEEVQALYIQKLLKEYAEQHQLHIDLPLFESAEAFLFEYETDKAVDLILLDIQMSEMTGLEMAEKLREKHDQVKIIFITGMTEHIGDGYRVEASDYLVKPITKERFFAVLDRVIQTIPQEIRTVIFTNTAGEQVKVAMNDVVAAEVSGREIAITTTNETFGIRSSMSELKKELDETVFVAPDRSWLVHCGHIERVQKTELIMDNGMTIPVSRRNAKPVTQAFIDFHRR